MITIVSGLPRSGTSLMMQILANSGYDILTDGIRKPDENNLEGYFEYEKVKSLRTDNTWMGLAEGKVVKIIAQLLSYLPAGFDYEIYFMERNIDEVIASQNKMIVRLNKNVKLLDSIAIKNVFLKQEDNIKRNINSTQSIKWISINFNNLVNCSLDEINKLESFSNQKLTMENILKTVKPDLYRERL